MTKEVLIGTLAILSSLASDALGNGAPLPLRPDPTPPATQTQPASKPKQSAVGMIALGVGLAALLASGGLYLVRRQQR